MVNDTKIEPVALCSLFDHKNVKLFLGVKPKLEGKKSAMSNRFLEEPIFGITVKSCVLRTHLMSLDIDNDPDPVHSELVRTEKNKVNELWTNIKKLF